MSSGNGVIRLHRSQQPFERNATGLYKCQYSLNGYGITVHVGIYHQGDAGSLEVPNGIGFTLESDPSEDTPIFSLSCNSASGPVVNITWTYNGQQIDSAWEQHSRLVSPTEARYNNSLRVEGRFVGLYRCTVMNNQEMSAVSATLDVQDAPMPRDVFLSQVNRTVLKVTWTRSSSRVFVTHQRVYVESKGVRSAIDTGGSGRSLIVTDLQPESTYSVFVQTLSAQLPSTLSPPVTTFLEDTLPLSSPAITSVVSNSPSSLTVSWNQSVIHAVDYYQLLFTYTGPCKDHKHQRMAKVNANTREYVMTGLREYSQYQVQVTAVRGFRRAGCSAMGNTASGTPGAPRILSAEPSNFFFGSIDITWSHTPCINRNGDIKAYRLQVRFSKYSWVPANSRSPRSDPQFIEFTFQPSALLADSVNTYTITDLVITAEYHISVAAVTRQGTIGRYSPSIVANASHPQVFGFMFRGQLLPNNSAVSLEEVGVDEAALLCLTETNKTLKGTGEGEWYYPNGVQVSTRRSGDTMYRNRGDGIVLLHQRETDDDYYYYYYYRYYNSAIEGRYRCEIPDKNGSLRSLYIHLFNSDVFIESGILFQLESQLFDSPPSFTLTCSTAGGPPIEVQWRINGEPAELFSDYVTLFQTQSSYFLKVRNETAGLYEFSISKGAQNSSTSKSRQLLLEVPDTPSSFQAHQLGLNSIKLSWNSVAKATGYHIRLAKDNQTIIVQYVDRNSTELTFSDLEVYGEYTLSMIAVVKYLPSARTSLVRVYMKQAPNVALQVTSPSQAYTGETYSIECTIRSELSHKPLVSRNVTVQWLNGTSRRFPVQPIVKEECSVQSVLTVDSLTHTLKIQELHSHHTGTYLCLVTVEDVLFEAYFTIPALTNGTDQTVDSQDNLEDCSLVARGTSAVNGLTVTWQPSSTNRSQCLNEWVLNNGTCGASFTAVVGLTSPLVVEDRWHRCSIMPTRFTFTQACFEDTTGLLTSQINNSTSFTLSWAPLPCSLHHGVTIGYSIQYSTVPMSSTNSHSRTETVLGSTSIELMGNPFTRYSARIAAIWEDSSRGAYLPPASVFLPAEGVGLMLNGEPLQNHSFINLDYIGHNDSHSLLCVTDSVSCCSREADGLTGQWLSPNGSLVSLFKSENTSGQAHRASSVGLYQAIQDPLPGGVYLCEIPDRAETTQRMFVWLYHQDTIFQPTVSAVQDRTPLTGEDYLLLCAIVINTEVHEVLSIQWLKMPTRTHLDNSDVSTVAINGSDFHKVSSALNLSPVDSSVGGVYTCQVQLTHDPVMYEQSTNVTVKISAPNVTVTASPSERQYEGVKLELTCLIRYSQFINNSLISVGTRWTGLNGRIVQRTNESSESNVWRDTMVVDQLSVEASGTVTCEVDTQVQSNQFLIPAELTTASLTITIIPILAPAGPPVNFSSVILQPHLVTFSWEPPLAELQNGPIIGYSIRCCAAESEYTVGNECVEELNITGGSIAMTQFIPGTAYNCSLVSYTRSGGSPSAVLTVETPKDELLFQIVLRGVSNCSQLAICDGGAKRTALISIIDDAILPDCPLSNCSTNRKSHEIKNAGFICSTNSDALVFQAVLGSRSEVSAMNLVGKLQQWILQGLTVNVGGIFMTIESSCPTLIDSLGKVDCHLIPALAYDEDCRQAGVLSGAIIGAFIVAVIVTVVVFFVSRKICMKKKGTKMALKLTTNKQTTNICETSLKTQEDDIYIEPCTENMVPPEDEYAYIPVGAARYHVPGQLSRRPYKAAQDDEDAHRTVGETFREPTQKKECLSPAKKDEVHMPEREVEELNVEYFSMSTLGPSRGDNQEEDIYCTISQ